ncbi:MAG: gluconate 2-dehydrogenase subunit 3 family protein [Lewinellaceae bacterium]|nr:gluconate 2-dehydrogenase subunit 3 family protein [Phaeodactylibacter sp.]MCB0615485.1 gluconate 2-dehydrogenase subunit 3 family protein [Phaeodactylibacter sp.]MCB9350687.1 gluconate 2-dehydrogenase subunit 3 family protein [Lewinellaceae bacterium]
MDRRDTIKSLLLGSLAGGALLTGCTPEENLSPEAGAEASDTGGYGRTPEEKKRDEELASETFFTEAEIATLAVLCDLILPADDSFGSATDAGVPEFIEFIAKDIPEHQVPLRGGMMWLNHRANRMFGAEFTDCTGEQQKKLLDAIALPNEAAPELQPGVVFFSLLRSLTLSGYYTTKMGIESLAYKGNVSNIWDGVPEEVLAEHGLSYDEEWLAKCANPARSEVAEWDEEGNLIS